MDDTRTRYTQAYRIFRIARRNRSNADHDLAKEFKLSTKIVDTFFSAHLWTMRTPYKDHDTELYRALFRLGERVERAELKHDYKTIIEVDSILEKIQSDNPDQYCQPIVIAGQNHIRRMRGLEDLHI